MRSALTASLVLHLLGLLLWVAYGARVATTTLSAPRAIRVRVTGPAPSQTRPRNRRSPSPPAAPVETKPVVQPKSKSQPKPQPEPKPRPEPKPQSRPASRSQPKPRPAVTPERDAATTAATDTVAAPDLPSVTSLAGTDATVPPRFRYYLSLLEGAVTRRWHPGRIGFRGGRRVCVVHFHVEQDGRITRETVVRSSGVPLLDREALRAVRAVGRVPPLPAGLARRSLGVTFVFTLETASGGP